MPITRTSTFDNATGEYTHTYQLVADRTWLGFPQYLADCWPGDYLPIRPDVLSSLNLQVAGYEIERLADVLMPRGVGAWLYSRRYHYWNLIRALHRAGFIQRPDAGERFSWRRDFRILGPLRQWQAKRRETELLRSEVARWFDAATWGMARYGDPIAFSRWGHDDGSA